MVGGVFSQCLRTTGNPAAQNTENNARDSEDHEDKENRLRLIEVQQLTHPSDHGCEELADLRKQRGNNGGSSLKSSSFHKIFMGHLSRTEQENQQRKNSSKNNEIANLGDSKNAETILQR